MRRARSVACMTQLQAKQQQEFHEEPDEPDRASAERCGTFSMRRVSSSTIEYCSRGPLLYVTRALKMPRTKHNLTSASNLLAFQCHT